MREVRETQVVGKNPGTLERKATLTNTGNGTIEATTPLIQEIMITAIAEIGTMIQENTRSMTTATVRLENTTGIGAMVEGEIPRPDGMRLGTLKKTTVPLKSSIAKTVPSEKKMASSPPGKMRTESSKEV